jgi:hypothetical protein
MDEFEEQLGAYFERFYDVLMTPNSRDWSVKGVIDSRQNIYQISLDTKVISKIIEIMFLPIVQQFAKENQYQLVSTPYQNHYPDITLINLHNEYIALDFKRTYRTTPNSVNGFTLGAFTGYFRQRNSTKNITFPYQQYRAHYILGIIYTQTLIEASQDIFTIDQLPKIQSVASDFQLLLQEKWKLASDKTGSGNTKNIGSMHDINTLVSGNGIFAPHGMRVFDDYWTNFLTRDMAQAIDSTIPYRNLKEYWEWKSR